MHFEHLINTQTQDIQIYAKLSIYPKFSKFSFDFTNDVLLAVLLL